MQGIKVYLFNANLVIISFCAVQEVFLIRMANFNLKNFIKIGPRGKYGSEAANIMLEFILKTWPSV